MSKIKNYALDVYGEEGFEELLEKEGENYGERKEV